MTRFDKAQLVAFLRALDRHLTGKVEMVVIGGAAASVAYDARTRTADIDIFRLRAGTSEQVQAAAEKARLETGLSVSVAAATVADLPYDHEHRLKPVRGLRLDNLRLLVPDKYDLALSKAMRGYPHDIEAVQSMNEHHRLALPTLVKRFEAELMNVAVADPQRIALNVVMVVARLHGFDEGRKLAQRWNVPVPTRRR